MEFGSQNSTLESIRGKYEYQYPSGLDLQPGSELHETLRKEIMVRAEEAKEVMNRKASKWTELEKLMSVYVDMDAAEKAIKAKDPRKPLPIVVPAAFAMVETNMSFLVKAFLDASPIHALQPRGPEDAYGTILMELLIDWQVQQFRNDLAHYRVFRDANIYGFGVSVIRWAEHWGWKAPKPTEADLVLNYLDPNHRPADEWSMLTEGNEVTTLDPRLYWPDPNVPIENPQAAEFISWMELTNSMKLLEQERDGFLFNCKYVGDIQSTSYLMDRHQKIENIIPAGVDSMIPNSIQGGRQKTSPAHVLWMVINLVPKRWNLGASEYPEKWVFGLAGDRVIIQAAPLGLRHNRFPVAVAAPDTNGRDVTPLSRLELAQGLQSYMDWMMNAFMESQRVDINGRFLIDPSLVNMHDLADTSRRFIRARRSQWGKGHLADAMTQLATTNATNGNIPAAATIMQFLKDTTGAVDNLQGIMQTRGERRSATEARSANVGAMTKLERMAWMISRRYMRDCGYLMAAQTQQLQSNGTYLKIAGQREMQLREEFGVTDPSVYASPLDLSVDFDVIIQDNSIPNGDYSDAWMQVFQAVAASPQLSQMFSLPRIFEHLARMLGAKNLQSFLNSGGVIQPMVTPDGQVMDQSMGQFAQVPAVPPVAPFEPGGF